MTIITPDELKRTTTHDVRDHLKTLTRDQLEDFAERVVATLYGTGNLRGGSEVLDPDNEWTQSSIENVQEHVEDILNITKK